jgi:hypothetical protein
MYDALGSVRQIVEAIYKENEPHLFFLRACVDAFEKSEENFVQGLQTQDFPNVYSCVVALESIQERNANLIEVLISVVEKEIDVTIEMAVILDRNPAPGFSSGKKETLKEWTEKSKKYEAETVNSIRLKLEVQIERVAGLLQRLQRLMDVRKHHVQLKC